MSSMQNAASFIMIDYDVYSQSPSLSRVHEGDSNDCMRPEIVGWYTGALLAPSCLRKGTALSSTDGCQCRNMDPNMAKVFQFFEKSHISRLIEVKIPKFLQLGN